LVTASEWPGRVTEPLDEARLHAAVGVLASADPDLARIVERHGMPPLWPRDPGFQTIVRIILEQQVTLHSGRAAYDRLERAAGAVEPGPIVVLGEEGARRAGLTRQKARYVVGVANSVTAGAFDVDGVGRLDDDAARNVLLAIPGIGPWTIDVYLLMALRRPDAWPTADIALAASAQFVKRLPQRPTFAELDRLAESWRPWRSVAARLLWHSYLSGDRPRRSNGGTA
jgi:DNA-3-methyladenine glycosylase II